MIAHGTRSDWWALAFSLVLFSGVLTMPALAEDPPNQPQPSTGNAAAQMPDSTPLSTMLVGKLQTLKSRLEAREAQAVQLVTNSSSTGQTLSAANATDRQESVQSSQQLSTIQQTQEASLTESTATSTSLTSASSSLAQSKAAAGEVQVITDKEVAQLKRDAAWRPAGIVALVVAIGEMAYIGAHAIGWIP